MLPSPLASARTVHLAVHLTSVILLAAYSGALISILAVQIFTMPFTTMEGLLRDGTYRFGVVPHSAEYNLFSVIHDIPIMCLHTYIHTRIQIPGITPTDAYLDLLYSVQ
jgi:hypothetical protein